MLSNRDITLACKGKYRPYFFGGGGKGRGDAREKELMRFVRLNQIDTYNYGMGSVDIADELRVFCLLSSRSLDK